VQEIKRQLLVVVKQNTLTFNVNKNTISNIANGRTWKEVLH
jgi:hypothetical protein